MKARNYMIIKKLNLKKKKMKLLKYLPAVALTLASQGGQDLPGIALANCKTELGFQFNN